MRWRLRTRRATLDDSSPRLDGSPGTGGAPPAAVYSTVWLLLLHRSSRLPRPWWNTFTPSALFYSGAAPEATPVPIATLT